MERANPHNGRVPNDKIPDRRWAQVLLFGIPFGLVLGLISISGSHSTGLGPAVTVGVIGGAVFGLAMQRFVRLLERRRTGIAPLTSALDREDRATALHASQRGPMPRDPLVREAAAALARHQLDELARQSRQTVIVFVALGAITVVFALIVSPWWWLGTVLCAVVIAVRWSRLRSLRRRL